ncbi:MAG: TonB-dependent receptor plug domain-containing protein, partial [Desulfobacterales bacterium]|nr:TonB-dependent receptor plug domain-containing protein [Desulfobacterales bacterium]
MKRMHYCIIITMIELCWLFNPCVLTAEQGWENRDEAIQSLDELIETTKKEMDMINLFVTTAGRRPQKLNNAPSSISVITSEDIKASGATQIAEALIMLSGVDITYTTTTSPLRGGIRGFEKLPTNKILLMIDGVPWMFHTYGFPMFNFMPIGLDDIERIEVLKGPGSSLYGPNAMFGLINIITKKSKDSLGFHSSLRAGEWHTRIEDVKYNGSIGENLSYGISAGLNMIGNPDYVSWNSEPSQKNWKTYSTMEYNFSKNASLSVTGGYLKANRMVNVMESTGPIDWSGMDSYIASVSYQLQQPNLKLTGYIEDKNQNQGWSLGENNLFFPEGAWAVEFQHEFVPFKNNRFLWGGNVTHQYSNEPAIQDRSHNLYGSFFDNT